MKVLEFTYTKPNGEVSTRVVIETQKPNVHMHGIDISELTPEEYAELAKEYNALETVIAEYRAKLMSKYNLKHNFRMFIPERMTEVTAEFI